MEMLVAHLREPLVPPRQLRPEIAEELEDVIVRCLQKAPEDRFTDIDSVDKALAACDAAGEWDDDQAAAWWRQSRTSPAPEPELTPAAAV